jgi:hypothetical protein
MDADLFYWIWYTCNFVNAAETARLYSPNKTITQIYNEFVDDNPQVRENKDTFTLVNQGLIIMIAYGICVFPKDRFSDFAEMDYPICTRKFFRVILDEKNSMNERKSFLRRIRNAIAHGHFEFLSGISVDDPNGMKLWDGPPNGEVNFRVAISVRKFLSFLNEVGHQFAEFNAR